MSRVPTQITRSAVAGEGAGGRVARDSDAAELQPGIATEGALAGRRLADRDSEGGGELGECVPALRVVDAAAGDDERTLGGAEQRDQLADA